MKKLIERHVKYDEVSEYEIIDLSCFEGGFQLLYDEGFTEKAKGTKAAEIIDTGNGFDFIFSDGDIRDNKFISVELGYAQAVNMLALLLMTHQGYKFSVMSEVQKLN